MTTMQNKAFFLDRDGVIIKNVPYLNKVDNIQFMPRISESIRRINRLGFKCIVVTNQSGVARGFIEIEQLISIHQYITKCLHEEQAIIDAFYFCPHYPDGQVTKYSIDCNCRKPKPGLLQSAAHELNVNLSESIMVGDQVTDYEAGINAGCMSFLLSHPMKIDGKTLIFKRLDEVVDFVASKCGSNHQGRSRHI